MGTECWLDEHGYCRLIPIQEGTCYFLSSHQFKWVLFLTVTGKYLSLTITEQEATFLGNFDVLFNNTVIGGYLPSVTAMYFQCAATLRAVGALLRDTDTSNRLPLVNRAGASAFHLRPVDGMLLTVHETSESNGEFEKNYQLISIRFHTDTIVSELL